MTRRVQWDSEALPIGIAIDQLLYQVRQSEESGNVLLLDSVSIAEIMEDSDSVLALDAFVTPYAKLNRKMELLRVVMERTGDTVKPVAMQITDPFKQLGRTNVAVIFELSDGQTVSIFFHNPDTTPNKLTPADELISWKWLLNKKDITIVVAPERGKDLDIREVSRRIMRLAEKNSAAFGRANSKRAERMQNIQGLKDEIAGLEEELKSVQRDFEVAKIEREDSDNAAIKASDDFAQEILKSLIDDFGWKNQGDGQRLYWVTKEIGGGVVSMVNRDGIRRVSAKVIGGKIDAMHGDNPLVSVELRTDESAKENAKHLDDAVNAVDPNFSAKIQENADFDPTSPEGYAKVMADPKMQLKYQDSLDALFQGRIVAVRNSLRGLGWSAEHYSWPMTKGSYSMDVSIKHVGPGKNVVGVSYVVKGPGGFNLKTGDSLTKTPEQIAAEIDGSITSESSRVEIKDSDIEQQIQQLFSSGKIADSYKLANTTETMDEFSSRVFDESGSPELWNLPIDSVRAMTEEEFNAASYALDNWNFHSQNVVLLAKRKGTDQNIKDAEDFLKFHENAGGLSFEDLDSRREIEERINSGQKLPESDFNVDIPSLIAAIPKLDGLGISSLIIRPSGEINTVSDYDIKNSGVTDTDIFDAFGKGLLREATEASKTEAESDDMKAAREFLNSVIAGDKDKSDLMALLDEIEAFANAIVAAGKGDEYDALIGQAAERWAELDKQANG